MTVRAVSPNLTASQPQRSQSYQSEARVIQSLAKVQFVVHGTYHRMFEEGLKEMKSNEPGGKILDKIKLYSDPRPLQSLQRHFLIALFPVQIGSFI